MRRAAEDTIELTVELAADEMEDTLRNVAPHGATGDLEDSIDKHKVNRFEYLFDASVEYARFVIEGTPPHDIYPSTKDALWWEGAEHPVRHVRHPGTKAQNFPLAAREIEENRIEGYANEAAGIVRRQYG